ncbi:hypothetical protein [uncultured Veillonella sp.]|uniref:hypothetical protein n=1 Tax=uncultured Veillonella sp. TaxID=159268 RepID=UPI00260FCEDE|nr:hypothetical protein [uncultured Veillonella sp.]
MDTYITKFWLRLYGHKKQTFIGGFFTYVALLLGTILILFWAQISGEMKIVIQTMHDEVKLTEVNYEAEAMLVVLLQEYSHRKEQLAEGVMTLYSEDGEKETFYRLLRPLSANGLGRIIVKVKYKKTGLQAQYVAEFTDMDGVISLKAVRHM